MTHNARKIRAGSDEVDVEITSSRSPQLYLTLIYKKKKVAELSLFSTNHVAMLPVYHITLLVFVIKTLTPAADQTSSYCTKVTVLLQFLSGPTHPGTSCPSCEMEMLMHP